MSDQPIFFGQVKPTDASTGSGGASIDTGDAKLVEFSQLKLVGRPSTSSTEPRRQDAALPKIAEVAPITGEMDEATKAAIARQTELLATMKTEALARTTASVLVPTLDKDVRLALRARGEPQTLFGEGPYERRERLRRLVAQGLVAGATPSTISVESKVKETALEKETFFTPGSQELLAARMWLAKWSIPRAFYRLKEYKETYQDENPITREERISSFCESYGKTIQLLSSEVGDTRPLSAVKFSPDGELIAVGSFSSKLGIWSRHRQQKIATILNNQERVHSVQWHPDFKSEMLIPNDYDSGSIRMDYSTSPLALFSAGADCCVHMFSCRSGAGFEEVAVLEGHEERINRIEVHPSGRFIASTSGDETWRVWDIETRKELLLQEGHSRGVFALKHHPDGSLVVTSDIGGVIRLWDLRTGNSIGFLQGHVRQVLSLDLNPLNPHILASGSGDNSIKLWDLRELSCFDTLMAHKHIVSAVQFEPRYGRFLVSSSYDTEARFWSGIDWKCFKVLSAHEGFIMQSDISYDSSCLVTAGYDRTFKFWSANMKHESMDAEMSGG